MHSLRPAFYSPKLAARASVALRRAARPGQPRSHRRPALGLAADPRFQNYHRLLNRARWSAREAAGVLLRLWGAAFVPAGPLILGLDETVERRRGPRITARAIYRDAARSSRECFQKTSGLRWLSLHLLVPVRWARCVWALPFLTALCPSARYAPYVARGRRHKCR